MPYRDYEKKRDANRRWYLRNQIAILEKNRSSARVHITETQRNLKKAKREYVSLLKERDPCMDCGEHYPAVVMDYHHVRGEKVGSIGMMCSQNASWRLIDEEIAKCDLLCANCHRLRHNPSGDEELGSIPTGVLGAAGMSSSS